MARPILMTQTNRTHAEARGLSAPGFAALAAAFALALAFGLGALAPAQAHAAQTTPEQVSVSIPTEVPCALMADGTVVAPSSWTVENEGNVPARLAGASASANYGGLSFSATSSGAVLLKHSNGSTSYDAALLVPASGSLPITWAVSKVDPAAHPGLAANAARGPVELLSASFSFRGQAASPAVSVTGQRAYKSTLSASPSALPADVQVASAKWYSSVSASGPWSEIAGADSASLALGSDLIGKYVKCRLEYSGGDFDVPASESAACGPISKASAALSVSVSGTVGDGATLTASASGLPSDCTARASFTWQVSSDGKTWSDFATGETVVLGSAQVGKYVRCLASAGTDPLYNVSAGASATLGPVKAKQAFAVYSADDNSLDFYKRYDVPSAGDQFEGKTATAVYTGIETSWYGSSNIPWKGYASAITSAAVVDEGISPASCAYWFYDCSRMTSCDVTNWDTSKVTNMNDMFEGCSSLTTLDVSNFDTSNVTSMSSMFYNCKSLATLDVSRFDTSKVTNMKSMFDFCTSLVSLDASSWNTSKVANMNRMFYNCSSLTALDVSSWDTSKVTDMSFMFYSCGKLASLNASSFNVSSVTKMSSMFRYCSKLQEVSFGAGWKWVGTDGFLPSPSTRYIASADGLWHAKSDGSAYAPKDIPSNKADTYCAIAPTWAGAALSVSGDVKVGSTLRASASGVPAWASLKYQWYRDGSAIDGADSPEYACVPDDFGHKLTCKATEASGKISGELSSEPTAAVGKGRLTPAVKLSAPAMKNGNAITASVSGLATVGTSKIEYKWEWSPVADFSHDVSPLGETGNMHGVLTGAGDYYRCTVTVSGNPYYDYDDAVSDAFGPFAKGLAAAPTVAVSGGNEWGSTLSASVSGLPQYGSNSVSYQWEFSNDGKTWKDSTLDTAKTSALRVDGEGSIGTHYRCRVAVANDQYDVPLAYSADRGATVKAKAAAPTVTVSGSAVVGGSLTATATGAPSAGGSSYTYQWQYSKDGSTWTNSAMPSAKQQTLKLEYVAANNNSYGWRYRCVVTTANTYYDVPTAYSAGTGAVGKGSAALSGVLSTYTPSVNSAVKATVSGVPDAGTNELTYTWAVADSASAATWTTVKTTPGTTATSDSYTPTPAVAGKYLRCTVSGENTYYVLTSCARTSTATVAQGELATGSAKATLSGEAAYGQALTAKATGLPSGAVAKYQWYRGTSAIPGETSQTYKLAQADIGQQIKCVVTDGSGGYKGSLSTAATNAVAKAQAQASVSISGVAKIDQALTASASGLPSGDNAVHYQWARSKDKANWTNVGSDASTCKVADGVGDYYRVTITVSGNPCYEVAPATSEAFGPIAKADAAAPTVKVSGTQTIGNRLSASVSGQPRGTTATSYQWQYSSDGGKTWTNSTNDGAKTASMLLQPDGTLGKLYRCAVATANDYYNVPTAYSAATSAIGKGAYAAPAATISGDKTIESTLTCNVSGLPSAGSNSLSYQWQYSSDGKTWKDSTQPDAKSREFTPNYTWVNLYARCVVTTSNTYYDVAQAATATFGPFGKKTVSVSAALGGSAVTGGTLTCSVSSLPAHGTNAVSYQWQWSSDKSKWTNSSYSDAKTNSLKLQGADAGYYYRCVVSVSGNAYYDVSGAATAASAAIGKGTAAAPTVTVSGDAEVGSTLTATVSGQPAGTTSTSYQWQRADSADGTYSNISGATGSTYKPTNADSGKYLKCSVSTASTYYTVPAAASAACGPVKSMQAFAVYSADDNSLNFYKRLDVPARGSTFEGKAATAVYTGIERNNYLDYARVPWKGYASTIASAAVVDEGISPASCANWFHSCGKMASCDVSKLDISKATDMRCMYWGCRSLTSLDVSAWNTAKAKNMYAMFWDCSSLTSLDVSAWNTANATDMSFMFSGCGSLTSLDVSHFDTSKVTGMSAMFQSCGSLTSLDVSHFDTSKVTGMSSMFKNCKSLTSLDVSHFDTANATGMYSMFYNCSALTTLDVSHFDTANATGMYSMFYDCKSLASLDVSTWDTSQVANMSSMFEGCSSLTALGVSGWDTSKATNMSYIFSGCKSLASLDVSAWDTSKVVDMSWMLQSCSSLAALDVSAWDTSQVANMSGVFFGCASLASLDVSHFDTANATDMSSMFRGCSALTTLDVSGWDTSKVTNMRNMFDGCTKLQEVSFGAAWKWVGTNGFLPAPSSSYIAEADGKWHAKSDGAAYAPADIPSNKADTYYAVMPTAFAVYSADDNSLDFYKRAEVPAVGSTFEGKTATAVYTGIETDVYTLTFDANFNMGSSAPWYGYSGKIDSVSIVDNDIAPSSTAYWFYKLNAMTACDIKKLDTSKISDMTNMFSGCKKLPSLDLSTWNTSKTTNMGGMFTDCWALASLDVSSFDTSNVTYMVSMFNNCWALASLDVSSFDTSNVTNMTSMFCYCSKLKSLDLSHFDTSQVKNMDSMFSGCSSLTALDLSHFDTSQATDMSSMFQKCSELTTLDLSSFKISDNVKMIYTFDDCEKLSKVKVGSSFKWVGGSGHGYLPIPSSSYFTDADGKWYALSNGAGYAPSAIPSSKEDTYYASKSLRDAAVGSGDEPGDADEIAPMPAQEQGVAARSLPADGEDEAAAAPSVEVSLELARDGSRAAGPVAVTLSGDAGDAHAVLGKEGASVSLASGRYLVSCLPAPEADGSMADAPDPFWIEVSDGMGPVKISVGPASHRPAADVRERVAAIESWLAAAGSEVPEADTEALRRAIAAAGAALSACQGLEAVSESADGTE